MSNPTSAELLASLDKIRKNYITTLFPDSGPLRRELYPKHMEFFAATKEYTEVAFIAGNRCITPWTFLANNRPALSALCEGSFDVRSWDGEKECTAQASGGFLKGILPAFRVVLDNGQFFDCTGEHRVLTSEGFLSLRQLMSRASGLRLNRKREDYLANCAEDGYLCDPLLPIPTDSVRALFPALVDAQKQLQIIWPEDEEGHRLQRIHASLTSDRLSTQDDFQRLLGLFEPFVGLACDKSVLPLSDHTQAFLQWIAECGLERLTQILSDSQQCVYPSEIRGLGILNNFLRHDNQRRESLKSLSVFSQGLSIEESLPDAQHTAIFFPLFHPSLVGGRTIKTIVPLGLQPIVDFTVPQHKNYLAAGIFHHNTGKSLSATYAATNFLTGNYPHWWNGRVFAKPVNILVAGENAKLVRDSIQEKFLGPPNDIGTGMIPYDCILERRAKAGTADAADTVRVKSKYGISTLQFLSYDSGREAFQATARDVCVLDEEPPMDIYSEANMRLMTTQGLMMCAFTPLKGISEVVLSFIPGGKFTVEEKKPDHGLEIRL